MKTCNKLTLIMLVVFSQPTLAHTIPCNIKRSPEWKEFFERYVPCLGLSTVVGIISGGITKYLDKKIPQHTPIPRIIWIFISWTFESAIRNKVIESLQQDMDGCYIPHQKDLMNTTAWIASWITYLRFSV